MSEATTKACAKALLASWISRFRVPDEITTDRGPVFLSELWTTLARLMGTSLHPTTAYNPAANGMVERVHRSFKASLMARFTGENWKSQLPWVLLGLRTAPRANGEASPAEKVYGEPLTVPDEFFPTNADDADVSIARLRVGIGGIHTLRQNLLRQDQTLPPKGPIIVQTRLHQGRHLPLTRPYRGPFRVLQCTDKARSRGRPRKTVEPPEDHLRGGIPSPETPEDLPQQLISRTRGRLCRPAHFLE
ncbi:uncharacterized protein LOC135224849 [Macrobrachium nipponense]|uniref:uncharacterized protein LOC135224849 n=1 Tax=Macrobrachium nipponense TaxID=159736 RepID=UPI0030C87EC9